MTNISNIISSAKKQGRILTTFKKFNSGSFQSFIHNTNSGKVPSLSIPTNDSERFDQLASTVEGNLNSLSGIEAQVNAGILKAEKLGFRKPIVGVVARKVVIDFNKGKSKEILKSECGNFLKY